MATLDHEWEAAFDYVDKLTGKEPDPRVVLYNTLLTYKSTELLKSVQAARLPVQIDTLVRVLVSTWVRECLLRDPQNQIRWSWVRKEVIDKPDSTMQDWYVQVARERNGLAKRRGERLTWPSSIGEYRRGDAEALVRATQRPGGVEQGQLWPPQPPSLTPCTPMRHKSLLRNVPSVDDPSYGPFREFQNALKACLSYHHDLPVQPAINDQPKLADLYQRLSHSFFDSIFIDRPELEQLVDLCLADKSVNILSGPAGSGKTTLLLAIQEKFRTRKDVCVHYFSLKKKLRIKDGSSFCRAVYKDMFDQHVAGKRVDDYRIHKVQTQDRYQKLYEAILEEDRPVTSTEWLASLDRRRAERFEGPPDAEDPEDDLTCLLRFLGKSYARVIVLLDNIDRFNQRIQSEVVKKAVDGMAEYSMPLVAVRAVNPKWLARGESEGKGGDIVNFHRTAIPVRNLSMEAPVSMVRAFIMRRLQFMKRESHFIPPEHAVRMEELLHLLSLVFKDSEASSTVVGALDAWHNHSLRHVGISVAELCGRLVANVDPAYHYSDLLYPDDEFAVRQLRNYVFKYMTCGQALIYGAGCALNVYESPNRKPLLPFPELALLHYLSVRPRIRHGHRSATFGELTGVFAPLGLDAVDVARVIETLRDHEGGDECGFVIVDADDAPIDGSLPEDTAIELMDSGVYLLEKLTSRCEYLFWTALDTSVSMRLWKTQIEYPKTGLNDDERALIAARFVLAHHVPAVAAAVEQMKGNPILLKHYVEVMGSRTGFIGKILRSLNGYLVLHSGVAIEARETIRATEQMLGTIEALT